jgi:hypothetical protein
MCADGMQAPSQAALGDAAAAPGAFRYHSNFTEADYILNTGVHNQSAAEAYCNSQGGHLVSYASQYEQIEVESYYIGKVRAPQGGAPPIPSTRTPPHALAWCNWQAPRPHCTSCATAPAPPAALGRSRGQPLAPCRRASLS